MIDFVLIRVMFVLHCSLPVIHELNAVEDVDQMSRLRWSHSHRTLPNSELSFSFRSKLDALDDRIVNLDTRFVLYSQF